ncbi:MAG: hypothetical protein ABEJ27_04500 [Halodesulfurarchaeum sp.]
MATCTFCGSDLGEYDPVTVTRGGETVGRFCGYACLSAYIDAEGLIYGEACRC